MLFGCEPARNITASILVLSVTEFGIGPLVYPNDAYVFAAVLEKLYNLGVCLALLTLISVYLCTLVQFQKKIGVHDENELKLLQSVGEGVLLLTPEEKFIKFANE